jgi:hypothetical protein
VLDADAAPQSDGWAFRLNHGPAEVRPLFEFT